jgi:hypothetical protein
VVHGQIDLYSADGSTSTGFPNNAGYAPGTTMHALAFSNTTGATLTYAWSRYDGSAWVDVTAIAGKPWDYATTLADAGHSIRVTVTYAKEGYTSKVASLYAAIRLPAAAALGGLDANGEAVVGATLAATPEAAMLTLTPDAVVSWQWRLSGTIMDATSSSLALVPAYGGKTVAARYVLASPTKGTVESAWTYDPATLVTQGAANPYTVQTGTKNPVTAAVTGTPVVGQEMSVVLTNTTSADTVTYAWSFPGGKVFGTEATFVVPADLASLQLKLVVTSSRAGYRDLVYTQYYSVPGMTMAPVIAGGDGEILGLVSYSLPITGVPGGADVSVQWRLDSSTGTVVGGTSPTITLTQGDGRELWAKATVTAWGYQDFTSDWVKLGVVKIRQLGAVTHTITGTAEVGQTLALAVSEADPAQSVTITWYADGAWVGSGRTLPLTAAMQAKTITVAYAVYVPGYTPVAAGPITVGRVVGKTLTQPYAAIVPPTGGAIVGGTLAAEAGDRTESGTSASYEWSVDGRVVGHMATYEVGYGDAGRTVTLTATVTKAGFEPQTLTRTLAIPAVAVDVSGRVVGEAVVGRELTAAIPVPTDGLASYAWSLGSATAAPVATGARYTPASTAVGKRLWLTVVGTDADAGTHPIATLDLGVVQALASLGDVTVGVPGGGSTPAVGHPLTVSVAGAGSGAVVTTAWRLDTETGRLLASGPTFTPTLAHAGHRIVVIVTVRKTGYRDVRQVRSFVIPQAPLTLTVGKARLKRGAKQVVTVRSVAAGQTVTIKVRSTRIAVVRVLGNGKVTVIKAARYNGATTVAKAVGKDGLRVTFKVARKPGKQSVSAAASGRSTVSRSFTIKR